MQEKRFVEHYLDHELVCEIGAEDDGWHYTLSVVSHKGDDSNVLSERSPANYRSDIDALTACRGRGRGIIDLLPHRELES